MKSLILGLAVATFPLAAQAGEAVTYNVAGEEFEGYVASAKGESKGLVLIVHDWDGLTEYEQQRADMLAGMGYDAFAIDLYGKGNRPAEMGARTLRANKSETKRWLKFSLEGGGARTNGYALTAAFCGR